MDDDGRAEEDTVLFLGMQRNGGVVPVYRIPRLPRGPDVAEAAALQVHPCSVRGPHNQDRTRFFAHYYGIYHFNVFKSNRVCALLVLVVAAVALGPGG